MTVAPLRDPAVTTDDLTRADRVTYPTAPATRAAPLVAQRVHTRREIAHGRGSFLVPHRGRQREVPFQLLCGFPEHPAPETAAVEIAYFFSSLELVG